MSTENHELSQVYYVVSVIRKDKQPDEDYTYDRYEDAKKHFELFRNDDSGLYTKIELMTWLADNSSITVFDTIEFEEPTTMQTANQPVLAR